MNEGQDSSPAVGSFDFEVYSTGRGRRSCCSRFKLRCDAIGLHEKEVLLLSVAGSETAVKAMTAGLRSSTRDQKRIDYTVHLDRVNETSLTKCPDGYRIYRTRLGYGLWHVLCIAKREGFLPVIGDETVWQLLQSDRFTTPLLRAWVPWVCREMKKKGILVDLNQSGCQAGLIQADNETLDELVSTGVRQGQLAITVQNGEAPSRKKTLPSQEIKTLEDYLLAYGSLLGMQAERSLEPLHVPGQRPLPELDLMRAPFEAQRHVIEATRQALLRQKSVLLVGEMGTGKTIMGLAAIHAHAGGRPYRALVFCPGQLVNKWEREIRETIPGVEVIQVESWKNLLSLKRNKKPTGIEWYVIARDRAKLGAKWQPAFLRPKHLADGFVRCPKCGRRLVDEKREPILVGLPGRDGQAGTGLWKKRSHCEWVLSGRETDQESEGGQADRLVEGCGRLSLLARMNRPGHADYDMLA